MKKLTKYNPNSNYFLKLQIGLLVVLGTVNIAFTSSWVERKVDIIDLQYDTTYQTPAITVIPPLPLKNYTLNKKAGTKIIVKEESLFLDEMLKEKADPVDFIFDPNKRKMAGIKLARELKETIVLDFPDARVQFPGGNENIPSFIKSNMEYPRSAIEEGASCWFTLELIIDREGNVRKVNFTESSEDTYLFKEEVLGVIGKFPKFIPAVRNKEYTESRLIVPMEFILN